MSRIYDSSYLTQRRSERAIAGSFLYQPTPGVIQGSRPLLGIKDQSIINAVRTGQMTQYANYPGCIGISPGCPCTASALLPGSVTGIRFIVGSIIVSWNAPLNGGAGPFQYQVTPYLNGVALPSVITTATSYRFENLQDWQPYTFTICAMNAAGSGAVIPSTTFLAPPASLSRIMEDSAVQMDPLPSLKYVINAALDTVLASVSAANIGPTRGSRLLYVWSASMTQAWNWISDDARVSDMHDQWNWNQIPSLTGRAALSNNDSIIWMCSVVDYLAPFFVSNYQSIYQCPQVARVQAAGQWTAWQSAWNTWYAARQADGSVAAGTALPTNSANWGQTIVVDGVTVNNIASFPQPQQWTRLTVQGKKQGYLTYLWDTVTSTCLTEGQEVTIENSVAPATGAARDAEIDAVLQLSKTLTDQQKIIAEFWAGSSANMLSPPLMFFWLWKEYMRIQSLSCSSLMFSLLDLGIHLMEGARVTWRLKTKYMEARPIQEIRRRYTGTSMTYWNGTSDGSQWIPYQLLSFVTPPFADFTSGHSHFSKAFALTMNKWFGTAITKTPTIYDGETLMSPIIKKNESALYGDFVVATGTSEIQTGMVPASPITLSYSSWNEIADQVGMSRLYGGIHALTAHTASQSTAIVVDGYIQSSWAIRT